MGLDHGLWRKHYVRNWDHQKPEERHTVTVLKGGKPYPKADLDTDKIRYMVEEVITWRKANAIHGWFVRNVQSGHDDCRDYWVSREKLQELLDTVNEVVASCELVEGEVHNGDRLVDGEWQPIMEKGKTIKDPSLAAELLPTTSGFFFGSANYDQYYYNDLEETAKALTEVLKSENSTDFEYWSSW